MAKTDWKTEAKNLKKKVRKLKERVSEAMAPVADRVSDAVSDAVTGVAAAVHKVAHPVSPLAPAQFPALPVIKGAEFSAIGAGIKYKNRKDVMLVRLAPGTAIAGAFTTSTTRSGCVRDCEAKLALKAAPGDGAAIIVNSGNSNAFTGKVGDKAVAAVTGGVAAALGIPASRVFSSSTGVIGEPLPFEKITAVIDDLAAGLTEAAIEGAAQAIMTTDTFPKGATATIQGEGGEIHIAGIAKGSGMIAPDMATMLVYIFTDAKISQAALQKLVSRHVGGTFNSITVDSDTSTSDTLLVAATGQSEALALKGPALKAFEAALAQVMQDLALQVVRDGEGATKLIEVRVSGAASDQDAAKAAFAIANSPLVKTAVAGEDPNWGRIVMAIGKSGANAERDRLTIRFGDILVAEKGWKSPSYTEEEGAAYMKGQELLIDVNLGMGRAKRTVWTCDLTDRYVAINADYRS
ncbi:bifunctional glutamate N-acetyltransferase/amino-acid acetyltransferase ArgJ [Xinfangfangia sp. D13-10-4-6]|uniref:bifunctional glutamate N-acetyltransferase/amino-acid acetyltransferase ArgJ n=1 Tax=Pseudogemmobacter hezensis TaxID=2737662 RepID=UPI0015581B06|nr:bifunctional glutamate N-acetyltransferase/amino-acid acetyltransferase ArgJ [Pseudogemmobacter hezensis]NPD14148.1 bifunctional glutamate N-acetyltransferase/amino-acid acetyltransferase ArgJ [Pseudogemmobacter hezensis]